jgi:hypothetical protein
MTSTTFTKEEMQRWRAYKLRHSDWSEFKLVKKLLIEAMAREGY